MIAVDECWAESQGTGKLRFGLRHRTFDKLPIAMTPGYSSLHENSFEAG